LNACRNSGCNPVLIHSAFAEFDITVSHQGDQSEQIQQMYSRMEENVKKNLQNKPVEILDVTSGCGCTVVNIPAQPIQPYCC
jgi:hypothetical protein